MNQRHQFIDLGNRIIYNDGSVLLGEDGLLETLYNDNIELSNIFTEEIEEVERYNKKCFLWGLKEIDTQPIEIDHLSRQTDWNIPESYKCMDIEKYLFDRCSTEIEKERVTQELKEYGSRDMYIVLKAMVYLVDLMKENEIVWGVGRGSSVSSYCLYLIGIHSVDSIKYDLSIKEFLKS